jgi:hypothetical protein
MPTTQAVKSKSGYLKLANFTGTQNFASRSLEAALRACFDRRPEHTREWKPDEASHKHRVIVQISSQGGALCGRLAEYERGKQLEVIRRSTEDVESRYQVAEEDTPAAPEGFVQDILETSAFFACKGDKIAIMQSTAMKVKSLQDHFNWLLLGEPEGFRTGTLILANDSGGDWASQIREHGVAELKIGTSLSELFDENIPRTMGTLDVTQRILGPWLKRDAVDTTATAAFGHARYFGISTEVIVKVQAKAGPEAARLVDTLALGLRDDASGIALLLNNGKTLKGDDLITREAFDVQYLDGRPAVTQVYTALAAML